MPGLPEGEMAAGQINMKTLKELIIDTHCRKGPSKGTTKHGAFWLAVDPFCIRSFGGNGVGQEATDYRNYLELRHYRDGTVKAVVNFHGWHQNRGGSNSYMTVDIIDCTTVEDVIVILKGTTHDEDAVYGSYFNETLTKAMTDLGLAEALPSPDEATA